MRARPAVVDSHTARHETGCGRMYVTVGHLGDGPVEFRCHLAKSGTCADVMLKTLGRVASLALQHGAPAEAVAEQLRGLTCPAGTACLEAVAAELTGCSPRASTAARRAGTSAS